MIDCLAPKTTMSIPEFFQIQRGEKTFLELKSNRQLNKFADNIRKNKKLEKFIVTLTASALYARKVLAAEKGVDSLGIKLLALVRQWAYWILLIMCIVEIIRAGASGDSKKILGIIIKFMIIFGSMYFVPELFDAIKNAF